VLKNEEPAADNKAIDEKEPLSAEEFTNIEFEDLGKK
jgi:hypothetical protein